MVILEQLRWCLDNAQWHRFFWIVRVQALIFDRKTVAWHFDPTHDILRSLSLVQFLFKGWNASILGSGYRGVKVWKLKGTPLTLSVKELVLECHNRPLVLASVGFSRVIKIWAHCDALDLVEPHIYLVKIGRTLVSTALCVPAPARQKLLVKIFTRLATLMAREAHGHKTRARQKVRPITLNSDTNRSTQD